MSETWWKTNCYGSPKIEPVEVVGSSAHFVTIVYDWFGKKTQRRVAKGGECFPTWAEAHAALVRRTELRLASARRDLEAARGYHGNVKGMKEPTP